MSEFKKFNSEQEAKDWVKSGDYKFYLKAKKKEKRRIIRKSKTEKEQWVCQGVKEKPSLYDCLWITGDIHRINNIVDYCNGVPAKTAHVWVWNGDSAIQIEDASIPINEEHPLYKEWLVQQEVEHSPRYLEIWAKRNEGSGLTRLSNMYKAAYVGAVERIFK